MTTAEKCIKGRLFIVGSARSGTTLLQAMMAKNSGVFTFPESHFFCRTIRDGRRKRWFGMANVAAAAVALRELRSLVGKTEFHYRRRHWDWGIRGFASTFRKIIDAAALDNGCQVWVEKTPHHIDFLEEISKNIPGAKFIHLLRDGRDVTASQYAAQRQDPVYWRAWTLEQMAQSWGRDVSVSLGHLGCANHLFVFYDDLIADPEKILKAICDFTMLEYEPNMLNHWEAADTVLGQRKQEPWMQNIYQPISQTHLVKFNALLSTEQQKSVISNLLYDGDIHNAFIAASEKLSVSSVMRVSQ